ncbi:MAG: ABC transporter permease subunit [Bdellovibrionaceae bacterium]|nr:ABC transporter permease subunit [Bdellovibrio sp.]
MIKRNVWAVVLLFYVALFAGIEWLVRTDYISRALVPRPSDLILLLQTEPVLIWTAVKQTTFLTVSAFLLGSFLAFVTGLLVHQFHFLQRTFMPLTLFLQTVPIIAIAPLLVIYLGFSSVTTITAAIIVCFFPVFMATLVGLNLARKSQRELFYFLKAARWQNLFYLEIPSSLPTLLAGLKTAAGLAVIGVVSGEFLVGGGLGALIDSARLQQRVDIVFLALILLAAIGLTLMKTAQFVFEWIFKKYLVRF